MPGFQLESLTQYLKRYYEEDGNQTTEDVSKFLEWVDRFLSTNIPTTVTHLPVGFALVTAKGEQVCFNQNQLLDNRPMYDEGHHVTKGDGGRLGTSDYRSIPI